MKRTLLTSLLVLLIHLSGIAQNITGKIIDAKSNESIPYANIKVSESENLISNGEGFFTLSESNSDDKTVLTVTYLGYVSKQLTISELKNQDNTIKLEPGVFELDNVDVSNVKPDPNSVMAEVRKNLKRHYGGNGVPLKNTMFIREANSFKPAKLDIEITKSTGFTKSALKSANADVASFTSRLLSSPPQEFTDMLCNYYTGTVTIKDKPVFSSKLDVVKATKLKDENRTVALTDMEQMAGNIFLKHLDTTKYYRIKSGLFGSRDTVSLRKDFNRKKKNKKKSELTASKGNLSTFIYENNFLQSSKMDFVSKPELYEYAYEGAVYSTRNEFVYVISFKPKKSKAKYIGKLYVSETDYAVLKVDYDLAKGKTVSGVNLKFLLGIKASENVSKGTLIYKQNPSADGYYLQYAAVETGQYFYINRPLKFIELTDEDRDVVALDMKIEGNTKEITEFLNISQTEITAAAFEKAKEEEFDYIRLKRYDPKIWKDYTAIEPLEEMKQFKVIEE